MMDYLHKVTHMIAKDKKYDIQHIPFSNKLKKWVGKNYFCLSAYNNLQHKKYWISSKKNSKSLHRNLNRSSEV